MIHRQTNHHLTSPLHHHFFNSLNQLVMVDQPIFHGESHDFDLLTPQKMPLYGLPGVPSGTCTVAAGASVLLRTSGLALLRCSAMSAPLAGRMVSQDE